MGNHDSNELVGLVVRWMQCGQQPDSSYFDNICVRPDA